MRKVARGEVGSDLIIMIMSPSPPRQDAAYVEDGWLQRQLLGSCLLRIEGILFESDARVIRLASLRFDGSAEDHLVRGILEFEVRLLIHHGLGFCRDQGKACREWVKITVSSVERDVLWRVNKRGERRSRLLFSRSCRPTREVLWDCSNIELLKKSEVPAEHLGAFSRLMYPRDQRTGSARGRSLGFLEPRSERKEANHHGSPKWLKEIQ